MQNTIGKPKILSMTSIIKVVSTQHLVLLSASHKWLPSAKCLYPCKFKSLNAKGIHSLKRNVLWLLGKIFRLKNITGPIKFLLKIIFGISDYTEKEKLTRLALNHAWKGS